MTRSLQSVGLSIKRAQIRHHRALDAALTTLGLSLVQWDALRHLKSNPDASLHDLAVLIFQSDQAFGTLAARMADRGLVERLPGPGRAIRLRMTERGHDLLAKGSVLVDGVFTTSFAQLTAEEFDELGALLERLLDSDL